MAQRKVKLGLFRRLMKRCLCCTKNKELDEEVTSTLRNNPSEKLDSSRNNSLGEYREEGDGEGYSVSHGSETKSSSEKALTTSAEFGKFEPLLVNSTCQEEDPNLALTKTTREINQLLENCINPEKLNPEIKSLMAFLSSLECPFSWSPDKEGAEFQDGKWIFDDNERNGSMLIEYLTAKEHEFRLVKNNFFRTVCIYLVLAYEKAVLGHLASSAADICHCQALVSEAEESNCMLVMNGRKDGFYHVLMSSIAYINFLQESYSSSWNAVHTVQEKYSNLNVEAKAIIHGLHAGILMEYGYRGNRMALPHVRIALSLDSNCWLWSLSLGKLLGRFRRKTEFHMPAGKEELLALRRAADLQPEAQCLSHLADAYKHLSAVITRQECIPSHVKEIFSADEIENLPLTARNLYAKAASLEPNCPYNNARCAKGLLSLPIPFKDVDLAEKYMVRALHLAPNDSLVNHYAGYYYETRKEFEQALDSYWKALTVSGGSLSGLKGVGNFPAELGYLALQHKMERGQQEWAGTSTQVGGGGIRGGRYSIVRSTGGIGCVSRSSPLFQLDAMLSKYKSKTHKVQTLCNKGYYLLMFEKDFYGALSAFSDAISIDPKAVNLRKFWSVFGSSSFFQPCIPINVFQLMEKEIKKAIQLPSNRDNYTYLKAQLDFIRENRALNFQHTKHM